MKEKFLKKRDKDKNYYKDLQAKSLQRLKELSGRVWTDFNIHDPGITITDYLNYGLYDLHYRFSFPLEIYLNTDKGHNYVERGLYPKQGLYVNENVNEGDEAARKSIVTEEDYEELILGNFSKKLEKCIVKLNLKTFRYDVFVKTGQGDLDAEATQNLKRDITELYHQHRNIGESLGNIYFDFTPLDDKSRYQRRRYTKDVPYQFPEFDKSPKDPIPNHPFVADYHTIQYEFPDTYGISQRGIPDRDDPGYEAKVLQLKAYLLIFDILMAEQLQMVQRTASLLKLDKKTLRRKLPHVSIVDGERIIDQQKKQEIDRQIEDRFYALQKFRYLNVLDALYGENTRAFVDTDSLSTFNNKRESLLTKLPFLNESRFKSFNVKEPNSIPIIQEIYDGFFNYGKEKSNLPVKELKILSDEVFFKRYEFLLSPYSTLTGDQIPKEEPSENRKFYDEKRDYYILRLHFNLVWHGVLFESLLDYGTDLSNYRILKKDSNYFVVFFHPTKRIRIDMSLYFTDKNRLIDMTRLFCDFLLRYQPFQGCKPFYLIEYIHFDFLPADQLKNVLVVIPAQLSESNAALMLRERLPVHLHITFYYLPEHILRRFNRVYNNWRKAMAKSADIRSYYLEMQSILTPYRSTM